MVTVIYSINGLRNNLLMHIVFLIMTVLKSNTFIK